jgi:hypothetical protein
MWSSLKSVIWRTLFLAAMPMLLAGCSHKYDSNELDLGFYQWNKWHEQSAAGKTGTYQAPALGWEAFDRGVGELVRIPSEVADTGGVAWFHCRFTLPEQWEGRQVSMVFEGIDPVADVYLNEILIGTVQLSEDPYTIEVSDPIHYTLDNHLAIRVIWPSGGTPERAWGVTGKVIVKSNPDPR